MLITFISKLLLCSKTMCSTSAAPRSSLYCVQRCVICTFRIVASVVCNDASFVLQVTLSVMSIDRSPNPLTVACGRMQLWDTRKFKAPLHVWEGLPASFESTKVRAHCACVGIPRPTSSCYVREGLSARHPPRCAHRASSHAASDPPRCAQLGFCPMFCKAARS